ncbi:MAG: hypothetical protein KAH72_07895 [Flavobacteriaceae bacterium]|nr:hypothetical protein [Flavobacteriaceae bacterium]
MKKLYILIAIFGFTFFSIQSTNAQSESKDVKEKVYKITKTKTPQKVKEALKDYSGYKIYEKATYTKKSKGNVYKFKVQKGNWSHYLLIHENGKIVGIETGEHSSS